MRRRSRLGTLAETISSVTASLALVSNRAIPQSQEFVQDAANHLDVVVGGHFCINPLDVAMYCTGSTAKIASDGELFVPVKNAADDVQLGRGKGQAPSNLLPDDVAKHLRTRTTSVELFRYRLGGRSFVWRLLPLHDDGAWA